MAKTYLLTGGTGFLGSLLSVELIKRGDRIIFLGRAKVGESFEKRIKQVLFSLEPGLSLDKLTFLEADFQQKYLGLDRYLDKFFDRIDAVWHLAASLSFKEKDREDTFATNVYGLKNILSFALRINCPVYYVGTAYVHGQRPGKIFENDLIKPKRGFNNPYEESKFEAEQTVRRWGQKNSGQFIVFRPSILIERKRKTVSFFGYYAVVYSLLKLKKAMAGWAGKMFIPFLYCRESSLNLMPIDTAIDWMIKISEEPQSLGKIFHIINPHPFLMKDLARQTFKAAGLKIFAFPAPKFLVKLYFQIFNLVGLLFKPLRGVARKFSYYRYYIVEDNYYDMKNVEDVVGSEEISRMVFPSDFIFNIAEDFIKKIQ